MSKDSWNLPPGCTPDMILGNSKEDIEFDKYLDENLKDLAEEWVEEYSKKVKDWAMEKILDDPEDAFRRLFWTWLVKKYDEER